MLRFDIDTWKKRPDLYSMVRNSSITPLIPLRPVLKKGMTPIFHGDILVSRVDGSWHAMPEDVYRKIRSEFNG